MIRFWTKWHWWIIEGFIFTNISFLAVDIYIAHSMNHFHHKAEWIPLLFSLIAPLLLIIDLLRYKNKPNQYNGFIGIIIGFLSITIGIVGLLFHLQSQFFSDWTIKSLVYTAPFVAPLAYSGLGFLLLLNRTVKSNSIEWSKWIIFLAMGGFVGNFVLTLCDHAQNGFFKPIEWLPVGASAIAVGFLTATITGKSYHVMILTSLYLMVLQIVIGLLGFYFHLIAVLQGPSESLFNNIIYVAPTLAPLLFVNLAILSIFGLYDLKIKTSS